MTHEASKGVKFTREIHLPHFSLLKRSDGIVILTTPDSSWITLNEAKKYVEAMKEITDGVPHPVLAITGLKSSLDKDARTYAASGEAMQYTTATAVIIKSWLQRVIGKLIISVDKPSKPFLLFENSKDAIEWLKALTVKVAPAAYLWKRFYNNYANPVKPFRLFENSEEAIEWLKQGRA